MKLLTQYLIISIIIFSCKEGTGILEPKKEIQGSTSSPAYSIIFTTVDTVDATGSESFDGSGLGAASFDAFCNSQIVKWNMAQTYPILAGKTFRALINTSDRRRCYSDGCSQHQELESYHWPLQANREYRNEKGQIVGTTNSLATFTFPLTNSIWIWPTSGPNVWSGFSSTTKDYSPNNNNCDNFTKKIPVIDATTTTSGNAGVITDGLVYTSTSNCNSSNSVICVENYSSPTPTLGPDGDFGVIFTTTQKVDGTGSTAGDGLGNGIADFDAICAQEASTWGLNGVFKALINAGAQRRACYSAGCITREYAEGIDWPLGVNKEYRRLDRKTIIGTTNAGGVFDFPISKSLSGSFNTPSWGGFNPTGDWTADANTCSNYTVNTGASPTIMSNATSSQMITGASSNCNVLKPIVCATEFAKPAQGPTRTIFMTTNNYDGGDNWDGPGRYDNICNNEALAKGLNIETYKALVQANNSGTYKTWRKACQTANCGTGGASEHINWVLSPNQEYIREDGTIIGTTNSAGIFTFPLDNSFTGTADKFWTGFPSTFAILNIGGGQNNCLQLTYGLAGGTGFCGIGNSVSGTAVQQASKCSCAQTLKILCVEQTR